MRASHISADSHIVEPPNCYVDHIEPKYRDVAPRVIRHPDGFDTYYVRDMDKTTTVGLLAAAGLRNEEQQNYIATATFDQTPRGGWHPQQRLLAQDRDGIGGEIIYASLGMVLCSHLDYDYMNACFQAYNRWLEGFCGEAPERLFGLAQTAMVSVDAAIDDFRLAKERGFVGMMMPGNPQHEDYDHPDYDALWQCAVDLDRPICFHILSSRGGEIAKALEVNRGHPLNAFLKIMRSIQDMIGLFVLGGVFERHPKLKMVCAEGDAGWLPHFSYRIDHAVTFHNPGGNIEGFSKMPSEYIRDNVWVTFQDDWTAFQVKDLLNIDHLLWANDYPHSDSTWPFSQEMLADHSKGLTDLERDKITADNVRQLFNLPC
ncbi:MAG: amidohydrolase family protein [Gammaproteobacteria bacterium]